MYHRFLPADALWTFAMACNVYLSFFRQYDSAQLKGLEWKYLGACYGVPFIPAIVFLFVNTPSRGKVFGSAVVCFSPYTFICDLFLTNIAVAVVLDLPKMAGFENSGVLWTCLDCHSNHDIHIYSGRHGGVPLAQTAHFNGS
jgi:hypothetical protein